MTKTAIILGLSLIAFLGCNNSANKLENTQKKHDQSLTGSWNGRSKKPENPISKSWNIKREANGTFNSYEIMKVANRSQKINRSGNWWTQNGIYYHQNNRNNDTISFKYVVVNSESVKFISPEDNSEFIETKE